MSYFQQDREPDDNFGLWILLLFVAALLTILVMGCSHCEPEIQYVPTVVEVPVSIPPDPLPLPDTPGWEVTEQCVASEPWQGCLEAMGRDLLNSWLHILELRGIIGAHNDAVTD